MAGLGNSGWKIKQTDGVIQTDTVYQPSEKRMYVHTHQPNRDAILRHNQRLASISRDHKDLKRGLRIPEEDFPMICERYPGLIRGTPEERQNALTKVMAAHPEYVIIHHTKRLF